MALKIYECKYKTSEKKTNRIYKCIDFFLLLKVKIIKSNTNYQYIYIGHTGVKPLIHQSELGTYTKVVPFQEKSSFHFVVL